MLDTDVCTFCEHPNEDEIHLFCHCVQAQNVWKYVQKYIKDNDRMNVSGILQWTDFNIIFNNVHPKGSHVINFIVTIAKQYIYRTRCMKTIPNEKELTNIIEQIYETEFHIAQYNNKIRFHVAKWSCINDIDIPDETAEYIDSYIQQMH